MVKAATDEISWGPLRSLVGRWIGARERQWGSGQTEQMYEVRRFQRRPPYFNAITREQLFPVRFATKVSDFYQRRRQISEDTGYLIWRPDSKLITRIVTDPYGRAAIEEARAEQESDTIWMIFEPVKQILHHPSDNSLEIGIQRHGTTIIFDSSTFRFNLTSSSEGQTSFRDVGELMRIGY